MAHGLMTEQHLEFLSLKGDYTGSSESTLVRMSHCWKSHLAAHYLIFLKKYTKNCQKGAMGSFKSSSRTSPKRSVYE